MPRCSYLNRGHACTAYAEWQPSTFFIDFQQLEHRLILPRSASAFHETVACLLETMT
jgi:hypothetical protein